MCGIAGFSGDFAPELLARMSDKIRHRGPDDDGILYEAEKRIGLAHRRLSIIDLSPLGRQPMWDATQTVAIVFNGEIYNYRELRSELVAQGFQFRSQSDTEVLLNLYLRDGAAMLSKLNGIFAFALWDTRDDRLLVARDGLGVKPLYYAETSQGVLWSSEMKSLLEEPSLDRTVSPLAVHYHLSYLWCPAPTTILASVKKLEPGHAMTIHRGRIERRWQHYDLPYGPEHQVDHGLSAEEATRQIDSELARAVERQLVSDVPVGAFLSGGLDSSAVVAMAVRARGDSNIPCFTIGFDGKMDGGQGIPRDLPYAQRVARHLGTPLHVINVGSQMFGDLDKVLYHMDEPQADIAPIWCWKICELAREHGIKVLLSGAGGDDVFSGYRRHFALVNEGYWSWLPRRARWLLRHGSSRLPQQTSWGRRTAKAFCHADQPAEQRIAGYFRWLDADVERTLHASASREAADAMPFPNPLTDALQNVAPGRSRLDQMLYLEKKFFSADHNLNYTDKASMATGVEVRVPLLDPELVAAAAALPSRFKQRGREGKWIFKKAMEAYLPRDVIYRPKAGFGGVPLRRWLRNDLSPMIDDVLSAESLKRRGLFDAEAVTRLIRRDRDGKIDAAYPILSMLCIERWCQMFLDSAPQQSASSAGDWQSRKGAA